MAPPPISTTHSTSKKHNHQHRQRNLQHYNSFFVTKQPGCPLECGNIKVPYPFGIGVDCSLDSNFKIDCNTNSEPFLDELKVLSISPTQVRARNIVAYRCYDQAGCVTSDIFAWAQLSPTFTFSDTANKFMVFSCVDTGQLLGSGQAGYLSSGCGSICSHSTDMTDLNCTGIGCCQTSIPKGLKSYSVSLKSFGIRTQDKKVKKLYLPLAAAAPLPVGVITQAMRRVYRRVEALVEEVPTKQVPSRSSLKRGRAAEFHNLSEKRRRSRINEKNESIAESNPQLKQD